MVIIDLLPLGPLKQDLLVEEFQHPLMGMLLHVEQRPCCPHDGYYKRRADTHRAEADAGFVYWQAGINSLCSIHYKLFDFARMNDQSGAINAVG